MKSFVRSANNYDMSLATQSYATRNVDPSLTKQSDHDDSDINVIVRRFGLTGALPSVPVPPSYQEFDSVFDFQSAANLVRAATESFNALDAEVRTRFGNDPHRFVDFCQDEKNLPEMRKMGLAIPEPPAIIPPEPTRVTIVNPEALVPRETPK